MKERSSSFYKWISFSCWTCPTNSWNTKDEYIIQRTTGFRSSQFHHFYANQHFLIVYRTALALFDNPSIVDSSCSIQHCLSFAALWCQPHVVSLQYILETYSPLMSENDDRIMTTEMHNVQLLFPYCKQTSALDHVLFSILEHDTDLTTFSCKFSSEHIPCCWSIATFFPAIYFRSNAASLTGDGKHGPWNQSAKS